MVGEVAGSGIAAAPMTKRAVGGAAIGNLLEWYDFSVYGYLAGTIGKLFFSATDATTQLLLSFSIFGVGFFMRPVGAIVIGHFGDKHGRKGALIFTVMAMALGTVLIGVLPTYQTAGLFAAVLLTLARLIQGFSAGGEWGGSTAFLVEYAPAGQRGFIGSFQQVTTVGGLVLGSLVAWLLSVAFTDQQMLDWAWRLPFLLGFVIAPVGIYLRSKVEETPKYAEIERKREVAKAPFLEMLESYPKETFIAFGFTLLWTVGFYIVLTYMPTYMRSQLNLPYAILVRDHAWPDPAGGADPGVRRSFRPDRATSAADRFLRAVRRRHLPDVLVHRRRAPVLGGGAEPAGLGDSARALRRRRARRDRRDLPHQRALRDLVDRLQHRGRDLRRICADDCDLPDPNHRQSRRA